MFGWKRLSPWAHFWSGVPVLISGLGGAWAVVAVNSWMNQPQGYSPATGKVTSVEPLKVIFNPRGALRGAPHDPGGVPRDGLHRGVDLCGRDVARPARSRTIARAADPADRRRRSSTPIQFVVGDTAARAIAKDQPIKFAAMECVQKTSTDVTEYIFGRCTANGVKGGIGIPGFDSFLVGLQHGHTGHRSRHRAPDRPPAGRHDAPLVVRRDGRDLHAADPARDLARVRLVAEDRLRPVALVPPRHRALRRGGGRRARVRLDRHRGRAPALDRLQRHAHLRRGHAGERHLGRRSPRCSSSTPCSVRRWSSSCATMSRRWRRTATARSPPCPTARDRRRRDRHREHGMSQADAVAGSSGSARRSTPSSAAPTSAPDCGRCSRAGAERGARAAGADRLGDRAGLGGEPRLADLHARGRSGPASRPPSRPIISTLYVPLSLAALGIVLRGSGFAFHHDAQRGSSRALAERCSGSPRC